MTSKRVVMLGHAVCSENGSISGKAGNQSGKELRFQEWYDGNWTAVVRAKSGSKRTLIADSMVKAVNNKHIGYNQNERTTCYREALNNKWDISKIDKDCNTDCSALVSVCVNAAGIRVSKDIYTGNELSALIGTGEFKAYGQDKYTKITDNLKVGDILIKKGHTAIVIDIYMEYVFDRVLKYDPNGLMTGDDVKLLQTTLKDKGYSVGKADGIFGIKTESAVRKYQKTNGLTVDGEAGKKTIVSLGYKYK